LYFSKSSPVSAIVLGYLWFFMASLVYIFYCLIPVVMKCYPSNLTDNYNEVKANEVNATHDNPRDTSHDEVIISGIGISPETVQDNNISTAAKKKVFLLISYLFIFV
jgi:hypothetical protein